MEIKNNPFYELRSRLYASAAAGCSIISEDFRLKRAVEAFKPMSEANKAFGRLYGMCVSLLESDNPSGVITDCIALADALAVTQGTFADTSPTAPVKAIERIKPRKIPFSKLEEYISQVRAYASGTSRKNIPTDFKKAAHDPRILAEYIKLSGSSSSEADRMSRVFEEIYGDSLIEPLAGAIDLSDPKASGKQIVYICRIAGARQNELYIRLAENTENPQNVRINAIEAMAFSRDNAQRLLTLYQTEKGKVKNAALMALVQTESEEAEEVLAKLLKKYKPSCNEIIAASGGAVCTEFARSAVDYAISKDYAPDDKTRPEMPHITSMLANKKGVTDCFLKLMEHFTKFDFSKNDYSFFTVPVDINSVLYRNIVNHDDPEYKDMVLTLYEKYPHFFYTTRFTLGLITEPETVFETLKSDISHNFNKTYDIFKRIYFSDGFYRFPLKASEGIRPASIALFEHLPDNIIDFFTDTSALEKYADLPELISLQRQTAESLGREKCFTMINLMNEGNPDDYERIITAAEKLAFFLTHHFPVQPTCYILNIRKKYPTEGTLRRMVEYHLIYTTQTFKMYDLNNMPISEELLVSELKALEKSLPQLKNKVDPNVLKNQLNEIRKALEKHSG